MNNSCASCSFSCGSCNKKPSYPVNCCLSCERTRPDPLFPAGLSTRPQFKKPNPKCISKKQPAKLYNNKKKTCPDKPSLDSAIKSSSLNCHPSDCACPDCDKCTEIEDLAAIDNKQEPSQESFCEMANARSERNMKNYLHDNPELSDIKYKSSACCEVFDCLGPNDEVWVLQCPKGFDPKTIMNMEMGKLQRDKSSNIDFAAKRFNDKVSLACLTPEKAAEYEVICDRIKILKPVGKITVLENKVNLSRKSSKSSKLDVPIKCESAQDSCSESLDECSEDVDDRSQNPKASKKIKKKFNDQKFTIETTVTVENCGDRKKNRKMKQESCGECLPLVPPEPVVPTKKQKKKVKEEDLSWLDC